MARPFDRNATLPAPGKVDRSLKEVWVENPFDFNQNRLNLSAFERNRLYLNVRGRNFVEASYLSAADSDGDGRSVVAGDFRNQGKMDLVVRQAGGGVLLLYQNELPQGHYLKITLRGRKSNRLGIGARLIATVKGQKLVRDQFPQSTTFFSQAASIVHFGLGDSDRVERLKVRWPSGLEQELADLAGDRHIVIEEGNPAVETVVPGQPIAP